MAPLLLSLGLLIAGFCQAMPTSLDAHNVARQNPSVEVIYQFPPTMAPENTILRRNGQMLVTCLTCNVLSQVDPELGPDQEHRTVFTFPDAVIDVLGIDELSPDVFAVAVGQVDISDPLNITSNLIRGPTGMWIVDLRDYQAPAYDSSLVRAHRVGGASLGGLFDGVAVINHEKGLVAATDFVEGNIWLVDIPNNRTTVLVNSLLLSASGGSLSSTLLANGLKYKENKLYFTGTVTGTYGYVPVDLNTGRATGPIKVIYNYGFALDDFNYGPTGNVYFTTFADPDGGVIRRNAGTSDGQYGSEKILDYFATNSVVARNKGGNCELLMTVFLQFQVVRATVPGPC